MLTPVSIMLLTVIYSLCYPSFCLLSGGLKNWNTGRYLRTRDGKHFVFIQRLYALILMNRLIELNVYSITKDGDR